MSFTLAIVGRPNVGKSTLFNRLVGKRLALVDDQPGVTRDLREGEAKLGDLRFTVIDTAGLEEATDDSLQGRMRCLTERAVEMADACLFMIDARMGVTPTDEVFADILRRKGKPVFVAANKAEGMAADAGVMEAYGLGLGEPIRLSAEHGEGLNELYSALMPMADAFEERAKEIAPDVDVTVDDKDDVPDHTPTIKRPLQVAVVGRPNAGKSTLINKILARSGSTDRWWQREPIGAYAGWLTAASSVSIGLLLAGYGYTSQTTAAFIGLAIALAIAVAMQKARPDTLAYPLAVIWALVGVIISNFEPVNTSVIGLASVGIAYLTLATLKHRRS